MSESELSPWEPARAIESIHQEGLSAYSEFVTFVSDRLRLAAFTDRQAPKSVQWELSLVHSLPPPVPEVPLGVLASIGRHVLSGDLQFTHRLEGLPAVSRGPSHHRLLSWFTVSRPTLELLCPEAFVASSRRQQPQWLWAPPAATPPYTVGHLSLPELERAADRLREHRWGAAAAGFVLAYCLLRDDFVELKALLTSLRVTAGDLLVAVADAADVEADGPSLEMLRPAVRVAADRYDLSESPWLLFVALAKIGTFEGLGLHALSGDVVGDRLVALTGTQRSSRPPERAATAPAPALSEPAEEASPEAPDDAPQRLDPGIHRPSTAIASDLWTVTDELGYRPYAEALAAFIRDPRTLTPLTIGIKAPWGAGKTSLMRMVEEELSRADRPAGDEGPAEDRLTNGTVLELSNRPPEEAADDVAVPLGRRTRIVWFNAWKYQSGDQLWAGLAHAIVDQVTAGLSVTDRERFWARLNLRRVDPDVVRQRIHRAFGQRLGQWALVVPATLVAAGAAALVDPEVAGWIGVGGVAAMIGGVADQWRRFVRQEAVTSVPELLRDPGYDGRLGFLHLVHEDLERILDLATGPDQPLVVFIDDLDRCSYSTVAQVIEALNVFLSGDFANCVFVVAMEPDLVAAQIHVAYEKLFERIGADGNAGAASTLGWRFLEKMVQLPLALPSPDEAAVGGFVDAVTASAARSEAERLPDDDARVRAVRRRLEARRAVTTSYGVAPSLAGLGEAVQDTLQTVDAVDAALVQRVARDVYREEFDDNQPEVRAVIARFLPHVGRTPREIKRFINVFRFYAYVQFWRQTTGRPAVDLDGAGKLAALAIRAPEILSLLAAPVVVGPDPAGRLLAALEDAEDDERWNAVLEALGDRPVPPSLRPGAPLRALIAAEPKVGEVAGGFL